MKFRQTRWRSPKDVAAKVPRRRRLAIALSLSLSLAATGAVGSDLSTRDLERAWSDPRVHELTLDNRAASDALARGYGLDAFLLDGTRGSVAVTHCGDNGAGSLRSAIASAADGDLIDLRGLTCSTITLGGGEIVVPQTNLALIGNGPDTLTLNTKYDGRLLNHTGSGQFIVQGMTIAGGVVEGTEAAPSASGGCLRSSGTLSLGNALFVNVPSLGVRVEGCRAEANAAGNGLASGGGVFANELLLINSVVTGNVAIAHSDSAGFHIDGGGGVYVGRRLAMLTSVISNNAESGSKYGGGGAAITCSSVADSSLIMNSTISGNTARFGGGLTAGCETKIRNSTVSGNTADTGGGGLAIGGLLAENVVVSNSTIVGNRITSDGSGGGVFLNYGVEANFQSTIVHGNFRAQTVPDDFGGDVSPLGSNNLVGFSQLPLPAGTIVGVDPLLRPLGDYGGRTRTHAIPGNSQAIGTGNNLYGETTDQRGAGYPRVVGSLTDIGAYEYDPDAIFQNGFN
jgi:hypothetical protein